MTMPTRNSYGICQLAIVALLLFWTAGCGASPEVYTQPATELPAGEQAAVHMASHAEGNRYMVAAAHPLAAEAGNEMLARGGNAVDAAVATMFVLEVVEPMMSGIGGGGAIMIWDEEAGFADYVDAYASAGADPDHELEEMSGDEISPERHVAVPGAVGGLWEAHQRYGSLDWETLLQPAIDVARDGFYVHTLLARVIEDNEEKLTRDPDAAAIFYPEGEPLQAGDLLRRVELAETLQRIAREGRDGFYEGPVAQDIVETLQAGGSPITTDDLRNYEPNWRRPLCGVFDGHTVLTAPPPLSGTEVLQALALIEDFGIPNAERPTRDATSLAALVGAIRAARADRGEYIGDPQDAHVPAAAMASREYAAERRWVLDEDAPDQLEAGDPNAVDYTLAPECQALEAYDVAARPVETESEQIAHATASTDAVDIDTEERHTTHVSVVDAEGNAVSLTFTMGRFFGEGVYSGGAFLNTAAVNFGSSPDANRRGAYRTPRSSTAPTLVLQDNDVRLAVGSPGSGRIAPAITQMIMYTLGYGLHPAEAIQQPRIYPFVNSPTVRVEGSYPPEALRGLRERGYDLEAYTPFDLYFGGVHMVQVLEDGTRIGAADPRREGVAIGR